MNEKNTKKALIWNQILSEPLFTLYGFISFILYKNLGASAFLLSLLMTLKPVIPIFSFYWKSKCLKKNVVWAGFLMRAPFLLCPWIHSPWFLALAAINYTFFYRASTPSWVELLKRNLPENREKLFSLTSALGYAEGVVLSLAIGSLLDRESSLWNLCFSLSALIGLLTLWIQAKIPPTQETKEPLPWKEQIIRPWKDSWKLMQNRPDFATFQWGFMLSGFGIMLIQPALPIFAVDDLNVSYLEIAAAISIAKALGFTLSSPLWSRGMNRMPIHRLSAYVFAIVGCFPLLLGCSVWSIWWLYIAYFLYGIGQGGSHLVWNLSGPIFSGKESSSRYTSVNIALAALRGAIGPPLGGFLSVAFGSPLVFSLGALSCFYAVFLLRKFLRALPANSIGA